MLFRSNKNSIPFDPQPPSITSGIRVGSPSVTTQGMGVAEMRVIASLIARAIKEPTSASKIAGEVTDLCRRFPVYPER